MIILVLLRFVLTAGLLETKRGLTNVRGTFQRCQ